MVVFYRINLNDSMKTGWQAVNRKWYFLYSDGPMASNTTVGGYKDVVLINENESEQNSRNIVQPDISVICDKSKLTDKGGVGSPDMIIEVVSPSNSRDDYIKKLNLYEKF